jgi:hypothetical protein
MAERINLGKNLGELSTAPPGLGDFWMTKPMAEAVGYFQLPLPRLSFVLIREIGVARSVARNRFDSSFVILHSPLS